MNNIFNIVHVTMITRPIITIIMKLYDKQNIKRDSVFETLQSTTVSLIISPTFSQSQTI